MKNLRSGFTLIELLIVVAIIAILAAIAVPNFLEAQTRAKVTRNKADMRTIATALEAYFVDYNRYPFDGYGVSGSPPGFNYWALPKHLSTPTAYVTTVVFNDPFREGQNSNTNYQYKTIRYTCVESTWGDDYDNLAGNPVAVSIYYPAMTLEWGGWRLQGNGPDRNVNPSNQTNPIAAGGGWPGLSSLPPHNYPVAQLPQPYDPTNGTVSLGDILRSQKSVNGYANVN